MATIWKIRQGKRILEQGTAPGDPRAVLRQIMARELGKVAVLPKESYVVEAGGLVMGLYGDEFGAVPVEVDEKKVIKSGYLVQSDEARIQQSEETSIKEVLRSKQFRDQCRKLLEEDLFKAAEEMDFEASRSADTVVYPGAARAFKCLDGSDHHDMNGEAIDHAGDVHARCRRCGFVDPKPCRARVEVNVSRQ